MNGMKGPSFTILRAAVLTLAVAGCSEFDVTSLKDNASGDEPAPDTGEFPTDTGFVPPPDGVPLGQLSHDRVDLGVVCGDRIETVTLNSIGDGPLTVTMVQASGAGWALSHADLPAILEPGQTFEVHVQGSGDSEDGTLTIQTDEDGGTNLDIPMTATRDQPPVVTITRPTADSVLSPDADYSFEAMVSDDVDTPDTLTVQWRSSVDGELSTGPVSPDGMAVMGWTSVDQTSGDHRVEIEVQDSCGNTALDSVGFCQNEGYTEDSLDLASWHFEGTALWDTTNEWVELTGPFTAQAGTAFQTSAAVTSDNVVIEFEFYASGGSGADGISLTALDVDRMTSFVGGSGGGLGYLGLPGWSIEIDTYHNGHDPTSQDHLSFHVDGNVGSPAAWVALPDMEDGAWHSAAIAVVGNHVVVAIDGTTYMDTTIDGLIPFSAYVGFSAATGSLTNYHLIDALAVEGFVCDD